MKKIGFLFIDKSYAIYHAITIAMALVEKPDFEVSILCTKRNEVVVKKILGAKYSQQIKVKVLRPYWYITLPHYLEIKLQLRTVLFHRYKSLLGSFDAIVCTLYHDLGLKKIQSDQGTPLLVFADHGLSNRSYSFDPKIKAFDLFFLFGEKERKIRKALGQLESNKHAVIGFPKYDLLKNLPQKQFFQNNNPCILYNPHWQNELSSFFVFGEKILDFFTTNPNYNLIFAPHSLLLVRNKKLWFKALKYRNHANILIDWGSESSNDMSYTKAADLYLGDISSQALEFVLIKERPCLFLDAHQLLQEKDQLISWQLGPVIATVDEFEHSIQNAVSTHQEQYAEIQSKIVETMIYKSEQSASNLAAAAISDLLRDQ